MSEDDPYWRHRYEEIDRQHAETMRGYQSSIDRSRMEISRLDREIERRKRSAELDRWRDNLYENRKRVAAAIAEASFVPQSYRDEWSRELDQIDLTAASAEQGLISLSAKVTAYPTGGLDFIAAAQDWPKLKPRKDLLPENEDWSLPNFLGRKLPYAPRLEGPNVFELKLEQERRARKQEKELAEGQIEWIKSSIELLDSTRRVYATIRSRR